LGVLFIASLQQIFHQPSANLANILSSQIL
jgi:hypothetical protein